jgi:hypothetical protein
MDTTWSPLSVKVRFVGRPDVWSVISNSLESSIAAVSTVTRLQIFLGDLCYRLSCVGNILETRLVQRQSVHGFGRASGQAKQSDGIFDTIYDRKHMVFYGLRTGYDRIIRGFLV